LEAVLEKVRDPATVPLLCGVKATFTEILSPEVIVTGSEVPVKTNWELLLVAEETVILPPLALMVIGRVSVDPIVTLP
jgi:hypothetical protein